MWYCQCGTHAKVNLFLIVVTNCIKVYVSLAGAPHKEEAAWGFSLASHFPTEAYKANKAVIQSNRSSL